MEILKKGKHGLEMSLKKTLAYSILGKRFPLIRNTFAFDKSLSSFLLSFQYQRTFAKCRKLKR